MARAKEATKYYHCVLMKPPNDDVGRRLDRLLRLQFLLRCVLLIGWFMIILGLLAVFMTARLTPDQLASMLSTNPNFSLTIMHWITAPTNFGNVGEALLMLGFGLVSLAIIWKK